MDDPKHAQLWEEIKRLREDRHESNQSAQKLSSDFDGHLMLCNERHREIREKLDLLLALVKWGATTLFVLLIGIIGYLLKKAGVV